MKLNRLTFKIIFSFIRYHSREFVLFYTGMILSFLLLIFFSGNQIAAQYDSFRQTNLKRMYSYRLEKGQPLTETAEKILEFGGKDVKNLVFASSAEVEEENTPYSLTHVIKTWYLGNTIAENYIYSGRYWTENEELSGERVCLLKTGLGISSGKITVNGAEYSVIGTAALGDLVTQILVPFNTFVNAGFTDVTLFFLPDEGVIEQRAKAINDYILNTFYVVESQEPEIKSDWFIFSDYITEMSEPLLIMVLAIISYMLVYGYILKKRSYAYSIFRITGGSSLAVAALILGEYFIYSSSAFIVGEIIGYILVSVMEISSVLFTSRFISVNLFVFVIVFAISLVAIIPLIFRIIKSSGLTIYGKAV